MRKLFLLAVLLAPVCSFVLSPFALHPSQVMAQSRALWGSIAADNANGAISLGDYKSANNKILLSWRMLPGDDEETAFDIYRSIDGGATWTCLNNPNGVANKGIKATNYSLSPGSSRADQMFRLTYSRDTTTLARYTMPYAQISARRPYFSIPLQPTTDVCDDASIVYQANDCSVGDLDGDGQMEIVVKRLLTVIGTDGSVVSDGTGAGSSDRRARHCVVWDAYKLDGTLLWRIKSGPNIILGNSSNFAVADLDGDGRCEFVTKTGEGTVFGDGQAIPDTDGDGITDYRDNWVTHYTGTSDKGPGGPEFFSVCDGLTGQELARADFISAYDRGTTWTQQSESWGDDYWKRANSLRLGAASFDGQTMQVFLGRGVYGRTVVEGWHYAGGQLTRLWHFDSSAPGGSTANKDRKFNSAYAGQGNHSFNVADLDGDGLDEVMYGSAAFDNDGTGLWTTQLGHGDANHVGKFLPDREGLQVYHCLETGKTMVALHDARDGSTIWRKVSGSDNDMGRCMVADIDPSSPGCEFWWYGSNATSQDGERDLGYKPQSCNMGIWFDGSLSRQLINENIIHSQAHGRTFTMYRYDESFNNGTKSNPGFVGDFLGDWREEVILPDATKLRDLKVFSTWYPTDHRFPWLMTDHTYLLSCINQNVGYNQPTNLGYYLGTDIASDRQAWDAAVLVQDHTMVFPTAIASPRFDREHDAPHATPHSPRRGTYDLQGRRIDNAAAGSTSLSSGRTDERYGETSQRHTVSRHGIYIVNGSKVVQ